MTSRHVHGLEKAVVVDIDHAPVQGLLRRKRDGMKQEIELAPFLLDPLEDLLELSFGVDVKRHEDWSFEFLGERLDMLFGTIVKIGDGEIRAQGPKRLSAAPSNRLIVGDPDDQTLSSFQGDLGFGIDRYCHDTLVCFWPEDLLFISSDKVCCAIISSSSVGTT